MDFSLQISFNPDVRRKVTEANINYYREPFIHPKRKMQEHDFIYLLNGEWKIGQNSKVYTLKNDSILILNAGQTHYGVSRSKPDTKTMYFHITSDPDDSFDQENIIKNHISLNSFTDVSSAKKIKRIFFDIVTAKLSNDDRKASIFFDLLLNELGNIKENQNTEALGEKIKNLIQKNPEKFFSNSEIASILNVSTKTAETKFKNAYNTTIHQYMLNYKIEQAISYFEIFPEITLKNISYNLGFYDEYHLSKQFKKITGYSPSDYKKKFI